MSVTVHHGDSRDVVGALADASIDSVVCDPPYALVSIGKRFGADNAAPAKPGKSGAYARASAGFMGQKWDTGEVAFDSGFWREVLRVMKPGAHLLAFGGTRTYHRLAVAIEDAGFEIRDAIQWLYGSGFPKSHNVGKGIDKAAGAQREVVGKRTDGRYAYLGCDITGGRTIGGEAGTKEIGVITAPATEAARQWEGWGTALKPACEIICVARKPLIGTVAGNVLRYGTGALNIDGCRITTGQRPSEDATWESDQSLCDSCVDHAAQSAKPTAPETRASIATRNAEPTLSAKDEPIRRATSRADTGCSAGTMADTTDTNLNTGASGPNVMGRSPPATMFTTSTATDPTTGSKTCNACHVALTPQNTRSTRRPQSGERPPQQGRANTGPQGRWPANCVHDGSDEVVSGFPSTVGQIGGNNDPNGSMGYHGGARGVSRPGVPDTGSAARFFYTAKADAADRLGSKHPTVKPVDLMRWLVRLVTPPGGTVLDPFAGSGTTGMACLAEGFDAVLIEREAAYVADIRRRIAHVSGQDAPLFAEPAA